MERHGSKDPLAGHPRYQQVRQVGKGSFGFVSEVLDRQTGQTVACKFLERGRQINKYTVREILNQTKLKHPHVVKLKEVFLTDDYLVLVMEFMPGGTLLRHVPSGGLPEAEARWYFQQIVFAVDYCHRMGVANRDVKLENVLLLNHSHRPLVKLSDFGLSKDENVHSAPGSRVGTPEYLAPEVIASGMGSSYDGKLADVWSCGVLLFVMATARYPFQRPADTLLPTVQRVQRMLQRAVQGSFIFPASLALSAELKDLITKMLVVDPKERLTVAGVLSHPWCSLQPSTLSYNDLQIAKSMASMPSQEVLDAVAALVREARVHRGEPKILEPIPPGELDESTEDDQDFDYVPA